MLIKVRRCRKSAVYLQLLLSLSYRVDLSLPLESLKACILAFGQDDRLYKVIMKLSAGGVPLQEAPGGQGRLCGR